VAQVAKRDVCIPQDGRVVEAVCMECTNFGEEYEVSPQQSIRAALRGLFPRQSLIRVHQAGEGCGGSGVQGEAQGAADSVPGATSLLSARGGGGQGRGGG